MRVKEPVDVRFSCVSRVFCECFSINNKFNLTDRFVLIDFIITLDMATLLFR